MPQVGFIREKREIKFLILYVASRLIEPVPFETLQELVMCDSGVDFFDFSECLNSLVETEHLALSAEELYAVTEKGLRNGKACEDEIPYSVRLAADGLIEGCNQRLKRQAQVKTSVARRFNGTYTAVLTLNGDDGMTLMKLELAAPKEETARELVKRFQENPEQMYSGLLRQLFDRPEDK